MTEAYQCDKCGDYETGQPKTKWSYTRRYDSDTRLNDTETFEFCLDCSDELLYVIQNG